MVDTQGILLFINSTLDKVRKFDYTKLIPKGRVQKYKHGAAGVELTWGQEGLGIGIGAGQYDLWFGWSSYDLDDPAYGGEPWIVEEGTDPAV